MNHIGLFEGIGGFSLAARWMGWETIAWCEWNPFCQTNLKYHFPNAAAHGDITTTDFTIYRGKCGILTGGFPCQPYSTAGKRLGKADERHLWPHMLRAIREIQPAWVVGENVAGLINWDAGLVFNEVQANLETEGYEVIPFVLPAAGVGAPHRRDRVWFIARHANGANEGTTNGGTIKAAAGKVWRQQKGNVPESSDCDGAAADTGLQRQEERQQQPVGAEQLRKEWATANASSIGQEWREKPGSTGSIWQEHYKQPSRLCELSEWQEFPTQSPVCGRNDGIPRELDGITFSKWRNETIKAYGNAIVPQVALQIFKAIEQFEQQLNQP